MNRNAQPSPDAALSLPDPANTTPDPLPPTPSFPQIRPTRKSNKPKQKPSYLDDYYCSTLSSSIAHPIDKYLSYSNLSPMHKAYAFSLASEQEPATFRGANKHDCWIRAMKAELQALETNKTWILVDLPEGVKPR